MLAAAGGGGPHETKAKGLSDSSRGRILGRNPDESLKSFPPCYSQSPLQLCLEISIPSNSRNLLWFLQFSYCTL
jgi:hypothetical protein